MAPDARLTYRRLVLLAVLGLVGAVSLFLALAVPQKAEARPEWVHGNATACSDCHHTEPVSSFAPCSDCHDNNHVPNQECVKCHEGKTTAGATCWSCHYPGQPEPPPTQENCIACHGLHPHPFSYLGDNPSCTVCHSTNPTPHHDAVNQVAPTTCTDCHTTETHNGLQCTNCHSDTVHPSYPPVPSTCFQCHEEATYGGQTSCLTCHFGDANFAGKADNDIHDSTIPDAPISTSSCRSCHPEANKHAGQVACIQCHTQATAYHHNKASTPGFPACQECHGNKPQHGQGLDCRTCHTNAQHQVNPPTPPPSVCNYCHAPANFGVQNCFRCHTLPVYHAPHQVPGCNSHHGPFQIHDNLTSCESCHTNAKRGHHIGSVVIPDCRSCHEGKQFHVGQVTCQRCHQNAAHDNTPLNLPTPVWKVCLECHPFAAKAPACSECHDAAQHSATYRVPDDCTTCHQDKKLHAGKVQCRLCHTRIESGHHEDGKVEARACSSCHVTAEVHASRTEAGAAFTCATCHEGGPHGVLSKPGKDRCLDCHSEAEQHADGLECIQCHWPAAHDATPVAGQFGSFEPLAIRLPAPTGNAEVDERAEFTFTGFDLFTQLGLGLGLLLMGLMLRAMSAATPAPSGPDGDPGTPLCGYSRETDERVSGEREPGEDPEED